MLKDANQEEEVHQAAVPMLIRLRKIKRSFTTRSTLLLKLTSYLLIRAAAFSLLLHAKLKKQICAEIKAEKDFVLENLPNHPRSIHVKR